MLAHVIIVVIIVHVCSDELQVRAVMKPNIALKWPHSGSEKR